MQYDDAYIFSSLNFSRNKELVPLDELIDTLTYVAEWAVIRTFNEQLLPLPYISREDQYVLLNSAKSKKQYAY